jgi:thiosulfate dehydrogenase [quinone] large subunit
VVGQPSCQAFPGADADGGKGKTGAVLNEQGVKTGIDFFGKDAWIHDGNPTLGFLKFGASGPFKEFYNSIAGFVMYLMMWSVALWPANNPVLDEQILGALSMVVLGLTYAGDTWGAGASWGRSQMVRRFRILR